MSKRIFAIMFCIGLIATLTGCAQQTTQSLMIQLLEDTDPSANTENYKIFEEMESSSGEDIAVLFGLDSEKTDDSCCSEPTGIFLVHAGKLSDQYDILQGDLTHMYFSNMAWETDKKVSYDYVVIDEGGTESTTRYLEID